MGVACTTYCLDCNLRGPEIGDRGMLGQPCLSDEKDYNEDWGITSYNFGWIYAGLEAISLLPLDVEAYRAFLDAHQGHRLLLTTDHDDMDPDLEAGIDWDRLETFSFAADGFVTARFEMVCPETGAGVTTRHAEPLRSFDRRTLNQGEIDLLLAKIYDSPDCLDAFHHTSPSIDPHGDLGEMVGFLRRHQGREIVVNLRCD